MPRTAIYIDGGPFTEAIRGSGLSMDLNLMALLQESFPAEEITRVSFVTPRTPEFPYPAKHRNERARCEAFEAQGIAVTTTEVQIIESVFVDRGVEAVLATQMLTETLASETPPEHIVVISRRAALAPVLSALKDAGVRVTLAYFAFEIAPGNPLAPYAAEACDLSLDLALKHRISGPKPPHL